MYQHGKEDEEDDEHIKPSTYARNENSLLAKFVDETFSTKRGTAKRNKSNSIGNITYEEAMSVLDLEKVWSQSEGIVVQLKTLYMNSLNLRNSQVLDSVLVDFMGESHKIIELAKISRKDPKRVILDFQEMPETAQPVMQALTKLKLNAQQEGLRIFVPITKITRENRLNLVTAAKDALKAAKTELRQVRDETLRSVSKVEMLKEVVLSDGSSKGLKTMIMKMETHFAKQIDNLMAIKEKELLN